MSTIHTGYRATNIIPADMDSDKIISCILEMVNKYNEYFVKGKNHLHEKKGIGAEYPNVHLSLVNFTDKDGISKKTIDLCVIYPVGTKSRELDTYKLCGDE